MILALLLTRIPEPGQPRDGPLPAFFYILYKTQASLAAFPVFAKRLRPGPQVPARQTDARGRNRLSAA